MIVTVCKSCNVVTYIVGIDRCTYCGSTSVETKYIDAAFIKRDYVISRDVVVYPKSLRTGKRNEK